MESKYSKLIDAHNLISDISYKLRAGGLTLKKIENSTLISLESFVQKMDVIGESMDQVIEDNILHANEVEIIQYGLDELSGIMESLNETKR